VFDNLHIVARTAVVAAALSVGALSLPAFAEGPDAGFIFDGKHNDKYEDNGECQTIKQATRSLKKAKYKDIKYDEQYSKETVYFFYAQKPKRDGKPVSWHLYYDACERELIAKQSQE
jgi:hypothetical protein